MGEPMSIDASDAILVRTIPGRPRDVAGFGVRRVLPSIGHREVGPFVFFDHMGPAALPPGLGMDVPPHPHIGLATVTYLFDGEIEHRDSLGSRQRIRPGDVNWMVAGRGIVHSERSPEAARGGGATVHGIQSWVALPAELEDMAPRFDHHGVATLPRIDGPGVTLRVVAGTAYGERSPVAVCSPTLYVDAAMTRGSTLAIDDGHPERAIYVADGVLQCAGQTHGAGTMLVLREGAAVEVEAREDARVLLVGGAPLPGGRHMWWNFVASSKERIEAAKQAWRDDALGRIDGDASRVPLPEPRGP